MKKEEFTKILDDCFAMEGEMRKPHICFAKCPHRDICKRLLEEHNITFWGIAYIRNHM